MGCVFCKIISKKISSDVIYEDDNIVAFNDLSPVAPVHFLVIPKIHISSADEICDENKYIISEIFGHIPLICRNLGLNGEYRIVNNCGKMAGQTVNHIHFHVLSGREFGWPPG